jgi:predicted DNA-binding WGR domain protein
MPAAFQIRRRFAHHEGGTKAYQIHEIRRGSKVCVVFQYGSFSTGDDPVRMGGIVDIHGVGDASWAQAACNKKEREKTKRGYQDWDSDEASFTDPSVFVKTLSVMFGAKKSNSIVNDLDNAAMPAEPPAPAAQTSVKGKAMPATEESLPDWGTW